uniref:Uncharacterized protein n=1 Tax=Panagrolaimus sp. ES5 TaxID=591445 RepID=A0AC34FBP3_9BILA
MKGGTTKDAAVAPVNTQKSTAKNIRNEIVQLQKNKDKSSSSSQWITDVPTRSSSLFSEPTGFSSFVTTEESKLTSLKSYELSGTQSKQKHRKRSVSSDESSESSATGTSQDHPSLPHLNLTENDYSRQAAADRKWQEAVNVFLQHDPVTKIPRHRTRTAKYLIRRNYCSIKRDAGFRWKKAVEKFQSRRVFPSIPVPDSEWSEA